MIKAIITGFCVFGSFLSFGQVGIGISSPNSSAALDVDVSSITPKKGFLLPRVNLQNNADVTTIASPVSGMTVFNNLAGGSGSTLISGKRVSVWDGTSWQVVSSLGEIRSLKQPIDYVIASKALQNFTTDGTLGTINASAPVLVSWQTSEILVDNPTDISLNNSIITIKTASFYQISGLVNLRPNIGSTENSKIVLALQSSTDNGVTWNSVYSTYTPMEKGIATKTQTLAIPQILHQFGANEMVRVVLYKPMGATNFGANAGVMVNQVNDPTKSIRFTRIQQ